jgi:hypothetical protein
MSEERTAVTEESIGSFFTGLTHLLAQPAAILESQVAHFFADLQFRLEIAHTSKRHLDRYLASDFDVFRYILPDENRLSDILADLLKPNGLHGQGDLFLREFLKVVGTKPEQFLPRNVRHVMREDMTHHIMASHRRIDITIDFGVAGIGIENKPWAGEQPDQLRDYAAHLAKKYRDNFVLIYSLVMAHPHRA